MSRLTAAAQAYRVADAALEAHVREHGCRWGAACDERLPLLMASTAARDALERAAVADAEPLTITLELTFTLGPWEPRAEGQSRRSWHNRRVFDAEATIAAVVRHFSHARPAQPWVWTVFEPPTTQDGGRTARGTCATEPEARDAADAALAALVDGGGASPAAESVPPGASER